MTSVHRAEVADVAIGDEQVLWVGDRLHLLDPPGALVWRLLEVTHDAGELVQLVAGAADTDEETVAPGIASLLDSLLALGAVVNEASVGPTPVGRSVPDRPAPRD